MDNLCHTLVGAALGQAGLKRRTRFGMATLVIGANLPDIDILAIPFDASLTFRRGWTHGSLAWLVLPVVLTLAILVWSRFAGPSERSTVPTQLLLLAFAGVLSHPFLDWLNTYGVRLLMPFSDVWYYGDALFIVDPWLWLALGAAYMVSRRRERAGHPGWRTPARVALGGTAAYVALMIALSVASRATAVRVLVAGTRERPVRVMAGPVVADPSRRKLVFDLGAEYAVGEIAWRPGPVVSLETDRIAKLAEHPAASAAARTPEIRDFLYWSRFPYFRLAETDSGTWVEVADARYSGRGGGWATERVFVPAPAARN